MKEYSAKDYKWTPIQTGYIAFRVDQAYYIQIETSAIVENNQLSINTKTNWVIPINLVLVSNNLYITNVYPCSSPQKIVIVLSNDLNESIILTWDLLENKEIHNYSINGKYVFINGPSSETGYILNNNKYINLDTCLPNYFYKYNFAEFSTIWNNGFKISSNGK